jgi:hypothetical protein
MLSKVYSKLKELFGDRLKSSNSEWPVESDWYVGRYVIVPHFGRFGFEEFVVYDTAEYAWEGICDEPDDGSKVFFRCQTPEALFLALT